MFHTIYIKSDQVDVVHFDIKAINCIEYHKHECYVSNEYNVEGLSSMSMWVY